MTPAGTSRDRVTLSGVRGRGFHGVFEHEKREGQEFVVDVEIAVDLAPAGRTDDLGDTVNYGEIGAATLARIDDFVAINSTVEVALDGSVGAEVAGGRVISGPGGQPDFALGASLSRGGVSIIGFPATASRGRTSRIVARLDPAAPVTVARYLADRIVTEFGVARLKGLNLAERADALRAIAHPDFRDELATQG